MTSYKTFLNAVRAAISKAANKMSAQLARFEETATEKYNELAYVPIYETPTEVVWSGEITDQYWSISAPLKEGATYLVTIGESKWECVCKRYTDDGQSSLFITDTNDFDVGVNNAFLVMHQGVHCMGMVGYNHWKEDIFPGDIFTIQTTGDPVEVGKEWLHDYVDGKNQTVAEAVETAQESADKAQESADKAQESADKAQESADKAQESADKLVYGFGTEIPSYNNNKKIEYAMFPNALKVKNYTFGSCENLKEVYLPSVIEIEPYAFYGAGLTSIVIPKGVTNILYKTFNHCDSLMSITVEDGNDVYYSSGNCVIKKPTSLNSLSVTAGCGASVIPMDEEIKSIGSYAFKGITGLTSITIPDSVIYIGWEAFANCGNLNTFIPCAGYCDIGKDILRGTAIYNNSENWENGALYIGDWLIATKSDEVSGDYVVKDGTTSIAQYAFSKNENLISVSLPESISHISYGLFKNCSNLKAVTISSGVSFVATDAFSGCKSLTSIVLPDSVTSINNAAFAHCESLTSVTIGSRMASIMEEGFYNCTALTSITYNGTMERWNAIVLGENWNTGVPATEVVCTDGSVSLTEEESTT